MKRLILITMVVLLSASIAVAQEPCTADFDCNGDVSATDVSVFLSQFGRSPFFDPCPDCYDSPCPCTASGCDPPAPVPKTGQTTSYEPGDDGYYQKGVAIFQRYYKGVNIIRMFKMGETPVLRKMLKTSVPFVQFSTTQDSANHCALRAHRLKIIA